MCDKNYFNFFFSPHKHATKFHRCDDHHFEKSKLLYSDRPGNDDYFPQGEEYEDEIGIDDQQIGKRETSDKKSSHSNDEYDNFNSTMLMFENNRSINRGPLTRFITHVHFLSTKSIETEKSMLITKTRFPINIL